MFTSEGQPSSLLSALRKHVHRCCIRSSRGASGPGYDRLCLIGIRPATRPALFSTLFLTQTPSSLRAFLRLGPEDRALPCAGIKISRVYDLPVTRGSTFTRLVASIERFFSFFPISPFFPIFSLLFFILSSRGSGMGSGFQPDEGWTNGDRSEFPVAKG